MNSNDSFVATVLQKEILAKEVLAEETLAKENGTVLSPLSEPYKTAPIKELPIPESSSALFALITEFLHEETHSVWIGPSLADDSDTLEGIAVVLEKSGEEFRAIYLTYKETDALFPSLPSLKDYTHLRPDADLPGGVEITVADKEFDEAIGFNTEHHFNYDLQGPLLSGQHALMLAVSYALSGTGEATVSRYDPYDDETDYWESITADETFFSVSLFYQWYEQVGGALPGFGSQVYCRDQYTERDDTHNCAEEAE